MSGHSKWSTIKRQKGTADAKRGNLFTKLSNSIAIAVREGGSGDPGFNFKLRLAIDKAKEANMPKDNISRAIEKGLGKGEGAGLENATFEGFGPGGVSVIVETITDNTTRTGSELRNYFQKHGGNLGSSGSVAYLFTRYGEIEVQKTGLTFDQVFDKASEAGAEDVEELDEYYYIYTEPNSLHLVRENLEKMTVAVSDASLVYRPNKETMVSLDDEKKESLQVFLEGLEELDDVQNVYDNVAV